MGRPASLPTSADNGFTNPAADPALNRYAMPNAVSSTPGSSVSTQLKDTPHTGTGDGQAMPSSRGAPTTVGPDSGYPYPQTLGPAAAATGSAEHDENGAAETPASPYRPGSTGRSTDFSLPTSGSGSSVSGGASTDFSSAPMPPLPLPTSSPAPASSSGSFSMPPLSPSGM